MPSDILKSLIALVTLSMFGTPIAEAQSIFDQVLRGVTEAAKSSKDHVNVEDRKRGKDENSSNSTGARRQFEKSAEGFNIKGTNLFAMPSGAWQCNKKDVLFDALIRHKPDGVTAMASLGAWAEQAQLIDTDLVSTICIREEDTLGGYRALLSMAAVSDDYGVIGITIIAQNPGLEIAIETLGERLGGNSQQLTGGSISVNEIISRYKAGEYDPADERRMIDFEYKLGRIRNACGDVCSFKTEVMSFPRSTVNGDSFEVVIRKTGRQFHDWYTQLDARVAMKSPFAAPNCKGQPGILEGLRASDLACGPNGEYGLLTMCVGSLTDKTGCSRDGNSDTATFRERFQRLRNEVAKKIAADTEKMRRNDL